MIDSLECQASCAYKSAAPPPLHNFRDDTAKAVADAEILNSKHEIRNKSQIFKREMFQTLKLGALEFVSCFEFRISCFYSAAPPLMFVLARRFFS